jgi:hypothetical protein
VTSWYTIKRRARPRFAPALALNAPMLRALWAMDRVSDRLSTRASNVDSRVGISLSS